MELSSITLVRRAPLGLQENTMGRYNPWAAAENAAAKKRWAERNADSDPQAAAILKKIQEEEEESRKARHAGEFDSCFDSNDGMR